MRVGVLASHRVPCGVAQYAERLSEALSRQWRVEAVILSGRADEGRSVPEESALEVYDVAEIGLWRDDGNYSLDVAAIRDLGLDAVHVQYQSMLFREPDLLRLRDGYSGVLAVTFHDRCITPSFPAEAFDLRFTHRAGVGVGSPETIPFGVEDRPPVVRTFGLGRTRADYIAPICERRGWVFEDAATHEPIHGGGQAWRTHEELIAWLRASDAVVLWYDEQPMAGSSQAARTAMAARRPVFTNDTEWFSDLPDREINYQKVATIDELEDSLARTFDRPYVQGSSWDSVAAHLVGRYAAVSR